MSVSTISSGSLVSRTSGMEFSPAKFLNSADLPSMTGSDARGPMSPSPRTAVPSLTTTTSRLVHVSIGEGFVCSDGAAHLSNTRRVGDREGTLRIERCCGLDRELATEREQQISSSVNSTLGTLMASVTRDTMTLLIGQPQAGLGY